MKRLDSKGFTLIELIATIVLLVLVMGIGAFSITKIINNSKEKDYTLLIKNIKDAVELYYQECRYSDNDMKNSCYYDFNFDGYFNEHDVSDLTWCSHEGEEFKSEMDCKYAKKFGDLNGDSLLNNRDAIELKNVYTNNVLFPGTDKNKFFTNLNKLVTFGYLTGNGKDGDDKYTLLNSKTGKDIGNCVISVQYDNGKFNITNIGSIFDKNVDDCPTSEDYDRILGG